MLDFWETMGRMVADEKNLRSSLLADRELTRPNTPVFVNAGGQTHREAWNIPTTKYDSLRGILNDHLTYQPISAFTLGEWLRVLPSDSLKKDFGRLPATGVKLQNRSPEFYAGLGAITVDDTFGEKFLHSPAESFPLVRDAQDRNDLRTIAGLTSAGQFMDVAVDFCRGNWPPPCFVLVEPYAANETHPSLENMPGARNMVVSACVGGALLASRAKTPLDRREFLQGAVVRGKRTS